VARTDVVTLLPDQPLHEAHDLLLDSDADLCVVLDERGVLLGRIDGVSDAAGPDTAVGDVMRLAPGTTKPDTFLHDAIEDLRRSRFQRTILTSREPNRAGRYLGVLFLSDAERMLEQNDNLSR
jgi:CBS domain-containing protein